MIIAFCLYKYFPYGGLQRDFLRIAQTVASRGHEVRVYTQQWQGERPKDFEIVIVPVKAKTNHGKNAQYYRWVDARLKQYSVDCVVGFNKMPGLDFYYAADVCYAEKVKREKGFLYKLTPRYRHYASFERATFERGAKTQLLMLTDTQVNDFVKHYHTEKSRFHILPPGIYPDRKYSSQPIGIREDFRKKNGIAEHQILLLQVGSDFRRKGVERSLRALAALPDNVRKECLYYVVGQDKPARYENLARQLGISEQVFFFAGRDDVAEMMSSADLLLHPAYQEAAGIVLLEGVVAGLPVIVSEVCGYAHHIKNADCGMVVPEPYAQETLNLTLFKAVTDTEKRQVWAKNARCYADTEDLYSLADKTADIILGSQHD